MFARIITPVILFALLNSQALAEKTTREIYEQNKGAVVLLLAYDSAGLPSALGSCFYFEPTKIASNYHVIDGASRIVFRATGSKDLHEVKKIVVASKKLDLAILEVEQEHQPVKVVGLEKVGVGDKVIAIGNPRGLEGSVSEGIISAFRGAGEVKILQITAPISPGSSGGPLFSANGEVIGVTTATLRDSQNLNFAVPSFLLSGLPEKGKDWERLVGKDLPVPEKGIAGIELISPSFSLAWTSEFFDFSLLNRNKRAIKNISYLLVFKEKKTGTVIHYKMELSKDIIPPGLAKRLKMSDSALADFKPHPEIQLRVLSYDIVSDNPESNIFE